MIFTLTEATDNELVAILQQSEGAMNLEELDGFFAALLCNPDRILPSIYIAEILGGELEKKSLFSTADDIQDFFNLLMEGWERIENSLVANSPHFIPFLCRDEQGNIQANDWAKGFLRGVSLGNPIWKQLFHDDVHGGALVPILALAHEHTTNPRLKLYTEPISSDKRALLIAGIETALPAIYRYFEPLRMEALLKGDKQAAVKTGRNELCPCGSGKKYKKCCNNVTLH